MTLHALPAGEPYRLSFRRLRAIRRAQDVTQKELGAVVGRNATTVLRWERDRNRPSVHELVGLARALHVAVTALYEVIDE